MTRISTATLNSTVLNSALNMENSYSKAEIQQSTGLVSSDFKGLGASSQKLLNLQNELTQTTAYQSVTASAATQTQTMYSIIGNMIDNITSLRSEISSAASGTSSSDLTTANAKGSDLLKQIATDLNTSEGGRYLFSGSKVDTSPVNLNTYSATSASDTSYYQGNNSVSSVSVSAQQSVSYGVTADNSAFSQALYACSQVATATTSTQISNALTLANTALTSLTNLQESVSSSANALSSASIMQTTVASLTDSSISDIKSVDVAAVSLTVSQYQTQLQASYQAAANTLKVNLTSYL